MVAALEARSLFADYPNGVRALSGAAIRLSQGELCAVIGPNGAGKSSLLRALVGMLPLRDGEVRSEGEDLLALAPRERARRHARLPAPIEAPP